MALQRAEMLNEVATTGVSPHAVELVTSHQEGGARDEPDSGERGVDTAGSVRDASQRSADNLQRHEAARRTKVSVDLRILVLAAAGAEPGLAAITQALDFQGTPYEVFEAAPAPVDPHVDRLAPSLASGDHGFFQGIILVTSLLGYTPDNSDTFRSALTPAEWQTLWDYETCFCVRQATYYTYPTADYGFGPARGVDTSATPVAATLTPAGRAVFPYVNTANPLTIRDAWTYLAQPLDADTTPLLTDGAGHALAAIRTYKDATGAVARENLALTFDGNEHLTHSLQLNYGLVNWVTGGRFVGARRTYLSAQVDDVFIANTVWRTRAGAVPPCGTDIDDDALLVECRITDVDLQTVRDWQSSRPAHNSIRLDLAFNGSGYDDLDDPLSALALRSSAEFGWVNHAWTHENLDDPVSYDVARAELESNITRGIAPRLVELTRAFNPANLVTPDVSGLNNAATMQAAFDLGIRYVVSDTSRDPITGLPVPPGVDRLSPNMGEYNRHQRSILMIPRRPNNLFGNVSEPGEWVAEYNCIHRAYWGRDLSYEEILDQESSILLRYLLRGEMAPWMFHQANLRAYASGKTLLTDLLDETLDKYNNLCLFPIQNLPMEDIGRMLADRIAQKAAGVTVSTVPGTASLRLCAERAATVPVTGLDYVGPDVPTVVEQYGGQPTTYVTLRPGQEVIIPPVVHAEVATTPSAVADETGGWPHLEGD